MRPLVSRVYKYKSAAMNFFCPLCRTERALQISPRLNTQNYIQVFLSALLIGVSTFPFIQAWSIVVALTSGLIVMSGIEIYKRLTFRKDVSCPHCGFDATWYKRDVKVAKELVERHWEKVPQAQEEEAPLTQ